jgi:hypothetical protein
MNDLLATVLGSTIATVLSITTVALTYVLGQYGSMRRQNRPAPERQPYRYPAFLLLGLFWLSIISFALLLSAIILQHPTILTIVLGVFSFGLLLLAIALSWLAREQLSNTV